MVRRWAESKCSTLRQTRILAREPVERQNHEEQTEYGNSGTVQPIQAESSQSSQLIVSSGVAVFFHFHVSRTPSLPELGTDRENTPSASISAVLERE
jgi:hypothetical protein